MADQTTHKCAFCYQFIEFNNIQFHDCVQGYSRVFIVETENTFYPQRIDGSLVRPPVIVQQPNQVVFQESQNLSAPSNVVHTTNRQAKQSTSKKKPLSENEIEILIDEVHKRPQLWNYNLHYEDRNHYDVDDLWQEVANSEGLAGRIDAKGAKNKFKNLKDTFRRIVRNEQGTSGSARKNSGKKWRFYEIMQFCRYSLLIDDTESNIMDEPIEPIELDAEPFGQEDAPEHNRADVPAAAVTPLQASAPRSRQIEPTPNFEFKILSKSSVVLDSRTLEYDVEVVDLNDEVCFLVAVPPAEIACPTSTGIIIKNLLSLERNRSRSNNNGNNVNSLKRSLLQLPPGTRNCLKPVRGIAGLARA